MATNNSYKTIREIQRDYFSLLCECVPKEWKELESTGRCIMDLVEQSSKSSQRSEIIVPSYQGRYQSVFEHRIDKLVEEIGKFWIARYSDIREAIQNTESLSLHDEFHFNIDPESKICRHGLYFDTICFVDPLFIPPYAFEVGWLKCTTEAEKRTQCFGACMSLLRIKHFALADCEPPLCIVYPHAEHMANDEGSLKILDDSLHYTIGYFQHMFGLTSPVSDMSELRKMLSEIPDSKINSLAKQEPEVEFLISFDIPEMPLSIHFRNENKDVFQGDPKTKAEEAFIRAFPFMRNRFRVEVSCNHEASNLCCDRLINGKKYWAFHKWALQYGCKETASKLHLSQEDAVLRAIEMDEVKWLGNINSEDLIRIRENGQMEEMRSLFRVNRARLKKATLDDYETVAREVAEQINWTVKEHNDRVDDRRNALHKQLSLTVGAFAITGSLGIASLFCPPLSSLAIGAAAISIILGGKSARDVINDVISGKKVMKEFRHRPVSVLAEASDIDIKDKSK